MTPANTSWKTTLLGVLTLVVTLGNAVIAWLNGHTPDVATTIAGVTTGVGLIVAKDHSTKDASKP